MSLGKCPLDASDKLFVLHCCRLTIGERVLRQQRLGDFLEMMSGPVSGVNASGLVTATNVYQDTPATVSGSSGGYNTTLGLLFSTPASMILRCMLPMASTTRGRCNTSARTTRTRSQASMPMATDKRTTSSTSLRQFRPTPTQSSASASILFPDARCSGTFASARFPCCATMC